MDTNVIIDLAEHERAPNPQTQEAVRACRYADELGYVLAIADATLIDLGRGGEARRDRLERAQRFPVVETEVSEDIAARARFPQPISPNDECDLRILSALNDESVAWVLTNDQMMIKRAERAELQRVVSLETFIAAVRPSIDREAELPGVFEVDPSLVDLSSQFFKSIESRYEGFNTWWIEKVVNPARTTLVIGEPGDPQGIAVLKFSDSSYGLGEDTGKICTFKIGESERGLRRGELLLAACLDRFREKQVRAVFVELDLSLSLVKWLKRFGFEVLRGAESEGGDGVMTKQLVPDLRTKRLSAWEYHQRLGPGAARPVKAHLVPIRANWHERLFPSSKQPTLGHSVFAESCGNAITKAYLSNAVRRALEPGDLLVFVESGTRQRVSNLGVLEGSLVTSDPFEVLKYVSDRTVYSSSDVRGMTASGEVSVLKFRHDRHLRDAWTHDLPGYADLVGSSAAQSIQSVKPEGMRWLKNQLGVLR